MALPQQVAEPAAYPLAALRIKRCAYRRLVSVAPGPEQLYEVDCLYPDRRLAIPLGDLDVALPVCNSCTAPHIFRPDED